MAARLKVILHIKASRLFVRCCSRGHLFLLFYIVKSYYDTTEPVQDKMFLKHVNSHRRSALYVRLSGSVDGVVWSKNLSFRLEFAS